MPKLLNTWRTLYLILLYCTKVYAECKTLHEEIYVFWSIHHFQSTNCLHHIKNIYLPLNNVNIKSFKKKCFTLVDLRMNVYYKHGIKSNNRIKISKYKINEVDFLILLDEAWSTNPKFLWQERPSFIWLFSKLKGTLCRATFK